MGEVLTSSNVFLAVKFLGVFAAVRFVLFPLMENLSLNTSKRKSQPTIPLYEIFLDYQHKSPEAWYEWIQKQDKQKQNQAFKCLVRYLDSPPELISPVIKDVIRLILAFRKTGAETAVYNFLLRISVPNPPKQFYDYYAHALKALIELNPQRAANFLDDQYQKYSNNPEYVKRFVFASSFFEADRLPTKLLSHYLLNTDYVLDERLKLLDTLLKKPDNFYMVAVAVLGRLLDNKDIDQSITERCFIETLKLKDINQTEFLKTLKILFDKTWVSNHLIAILKNHLAQAKELEVNPLSLASIITCINPISADSLKQILSELFQVSETEQVVIESTVEYGKFLKQAYLKLEQAINILDSDQELLPEFLEEKYCEFKDFCFNDKYNCFKIIYGKNPDEKFLILKRLANEEKKKLLILDIDQFSQDQTMLDNLETHLRAISNKILYVPGFEKLVKEVSNVDDSENIYRKIHNRFKFFALKSNTPIVISCDKSSLDTKALEFLDKEQEMPKQEFELDDFSKVEKLRIFNEALSQLNEERIVENILKDLDPMIEELSSLNFMVFMTNYIKLSLLSQGVLFSAEDYRKILESQEDESVSIKDLMAKVKIRD